LRGENPTYGKEQEIKVIIPEKLNVIAGKGSCQMKTLPAIKQKIIKKNNHALFGTD